MFFGIGLMVLALLALGGVWYSGRRKSAVASGAGGCIQTRPGKFAVWPEEAMIPHGDLRRIAQKYLPGDPQENGALAGGFLKAIDTYPDMNSAKYYQSEMKAWAESSKGLPHWSVVVGELLCD